jgi:hypothetical protein
VVFILLLKAFQRILIAKSIMILLWIIYKDSIFILKVNKIKRKLWDNVGYIVIKNPATPLFTRVR